ncbi:MAG: hypothetical protein K5696_07740, partial [Lachnospiraceae bacterium]|nr:hypothetical protein [Lachnospiraceae bacterium]
MKNEGIRKLIAGIGIAAMLFGNVADVIPSIAYAAEEQPVLTENEAPAEDAGGQEVAAPAEEPVPEEAPAEEGAPEESADTPDESAEQPEASDEGQLIEGEAAPEAGEGQTQEPEAAPGTAAPAETEAVTAETDKVGAVHLTASAVDEFGAEIDARYTGMELPASRDVIILNDPENPPYENIRKKTGSIGLIPTYSPSYDFVQATVNGVIVSAVSHEAIEGADYEAWYYRLPDGGYKRFTEDTVIRLEYSSPESYNASYSYADSTLVLRAQLSDPDAVDDAASLVVTPVTTDTAGYSYDAYMQALTACNPALKAEDTLLYDIAFMMGENEVQPTDASVKISLEFLQQQLSKALGASDGSE